MKTYQFTDQELDTLRDGLLALMEKNGQAFYLVRGDEAKKAVNKEWESNKALLDKLCGE